MSVMYESNIVDRAPGHPATPAILTLFCGADLINVLLESSGSVAMYYQTLHEHPMAFGYISRVPRSVHRRDLALHETINAAYRSGDYRPLAEQGFRYIVIDAQARVATDELRLLWEDDWARIYALP